MRELLIDQATSAERGEQAETVQAAATTMYISTPLARMPAAAIGACELAAAHAIAPERFTAAHGSCCEEARKAPACIL